MSVNLQLTLPHSQGAAVTEIVEEFPKMIWGCPISPPKEFEFFSWNIHLGKVVCQCNQFMLTSSYCVLGNHSELADRGFHLWVGELHGVRGRRIFQPPSSLLQIAPWIGISIKLWGIWDQITSRPSITNVSGNGGHSARKVRARQ